ncbi:MAG: TonB-dependent receptor, partial [Telluria sp.]
FYDARGTLFTGLRTLQVERGTPIAGLPRHSLKLGAQWQVSATLSVGADAQAFSRTGAQGNEDGLIADPVAGEALRRADLAIRGYGLLSMRASWEPATRWELYARLDNVLDRRYASFGAVGRNLFGTATGSDANTRFVAPGAPRMLRFGVRYRY